MPARAWGFKSPLRHEPQYPTGPCLDGDSSVGVVGEGDAELGRRARPCRRVGVGEHVDDVLERVDERLDLVGGELVAGDVLAELAFEALALALGVGDPAWRRR